MKDNLDVLLVGGGGRENALARALARSPRIGRLLAAPGNPGIARFAECVDVAAGDVDGLVALSVERGVGLVVVGPEQPLVAGLVDALEARGIAAAGPTQAAARLEGSKVFAKQTMSRLGIPHAEPYGVFEDFAEAERFIAETDGRVVVKADGLAAGKGVIVAHDRGSALAAAREMLLESRFGDAGRRVIVEPCLVGEEVSLLFVCDGTGAVPLASARDHKRLLDGDRGPNTGGMGAYSPGRADEALVSQVHRDVVSPLLSGLAEEGTPYRGILYCGVMLTEEGPKVLEFNCRFGDPEAQVILPRLRSCLVTLLETAAKGSLSEGSLQMGGSLQGGQLDWDPRTSLCVVLGAAGYPESPRKGDAIHGLETLDDELVIDHAGTRTDEAGQLRTAGGRVLAIGALGSNLADARRQVYQALEAVRFEGVQYRKDIGTA